KSCVFPSCYAAYTTTSCTYPLSLHDALPIYCKADYTRLFSLICSVCKQLITGTYQLDAAGNMVCSKRDRAHRLCISCGKLIQSQDRKSTRLNSSHVKISYAVFCLKKKQNRQS